MEENKNKCLLNLEFKLLNDKFEIYSIKKTYNENGYLARQENEILKVKNRADIKQRKKMITLFNIRFNLNKNSVQLENPFLGNYIFQTEEFFDYLDTKK